MELSPKAKLGIAYLLSILIPGILTVLSHLWHQKIPGWIWAPAGVLTVTLGVNYAIGLYKKIPPRGWGALLLVGALVADYHYWKGITFPIASKLIAAEYLVSIVLPAALLGYLRLANKVSVKKILYVSIAAADLYFMAHLSNGANEPPRMAIAFTLTSIFLFGSYIYKTFRSLPRDEDGHYRLNILTKIGLGIFKVMAGTRSKYFWFMSSIYFAGVMVLALPKHKPPWVWVIGGGTTLIYVIYNLAIMRREEKEIEARFSRPPLQQVYVGSNTGNTVSRIAVPPSVPDGARVHVSATQAPQEGQPEEETRTVTVAPPGERIRTVTVRAGGRDIGTFPIPPGQPDPIVEMILEPEPESRLARVLREDYPL